MIEEAYADFRRVFGRGPENPWFEEYMTEDADVILMGMGTLSLPVKVAIRSLRKQGKKVGLIRLRWFRPFPYEQLARALGPAKAIGVIDRDYSFGSPFGSGVVANEVRAALYNAEHRPPLIGFICGLGGREVTLEDVNKAVDICYAAAKQGPRGAGDLLAGRARVGERETMADATTFTNDTQVLLPFKGVKKVAIEEYFTSGHRTCQGCESALVMKLMVKASGPRTIVLGSTGCMYVANTTYYTTPWVVPWMHTQLGSSGSAALGTAAGLKALMKKGKMKSEPINVIAFCGDGGGADMGLGAISATLTHKEYNSLILLYDNESYANTDIQLSGLTPYGAHTTFSPPGAGEADHPHALEEEHGRACWPPVIRSAATWPRCARPTPWR